MFSLLVLCKRKHVEFDNSSAITRLLLSFQETKKISNFFETHDDTKEICTFPIYLMTIFYTCADKLDILTLQVNCH